MTTLNEMPDEIWAYMRIDEIHGVEFAKRAFAERELPQSKKYYSESFLEQRAKLAAEKIKYYGKYHPNPSIEEMERIILQTLKGTP